MIMKKRLFLALSMSMMAIVMLAIPAKRGLWQTVRLADGTEVRVQQVGDEHLHYWMDEAGVRYQETDGRFTVLTDEMLAQKEPARVFRKNARKNARRLPGMRKVEIGEKTTYEGEKKGLVFLAQYTDVQFKAANNKEKYEKILNQENFTSSEGFKGSVADYFKAQSGGKFQLTFDVYGPFTLANNQRYYGGNNSQGDDLRPEEMVIEAINMYKDEIDFSKYDWDGDGEVDQVFILYAGKGEADGGSSNTVWPHMWSLEEAGSELVIGDTIRINNYACSNEIDPYGNIEGIGCFCHEFSHCLGFPDLYDTSYGGWFGMDAFDLMCSGSYNGNGFLPAGYSAYEKMMCSWQEPVVLDKENVTVEDLLPMSEGGQGYIIYNDAHPDEYYMVENRQLTKWDAGLPGKGLMITHIDFDKNIWMENNPNTKITASQAAQYGLTANDHQRVTIFHADNNDDSGYGSYYKTTATDLYPYNGNDSLTNTSKPAAKLYNANTDGKKLMNKAILHIKQNADKTMSFDYRAAETESQEDPDDPVDPEDPDDPDEPITGDGDYVKVKKEEQVVVGQQYVLVNEDYKLGAGPYVSQSKSLSCVDVVVDGGTVSGEDLNVFTLGGSNGSYSLKMSDGSFLAANQAKALKSSSNEMRIWKVIATNGGYAVAAVNQVVIGTIQFNYNSGNSCFLNYTSSQKPALLYVKKATEEDPTAIRVIDFSGTSTTDQRIYSIDGRYVGNDLHALGKGIYIVNGKKVVL